MSVYQKRHYDDVAAILAEEKLFQNAQVSVEGSISIGSITNIIYTFADLFAEDNPKFQRDRFLVACGLEEK